MATYMDVDEEQGIIHIQNELNQIESDTVTQHVLLLDLQKKRKNLEIEIEKKNVELQNVNQLNLDLEGEMQYHQMRVTEMEKRQESNESRVQEIRSEIENLRSKINDEKSKSDLTLQVFEKRKSEIMTTLLKAPDLYDHEHVEKNLSTLKQNKEIISQKMDEIDHLLQMFSKKFQLTSADINNINNLSKVWKTMQKSITFAEQENKIFKQKIEELKKLLKTLTKQKTDV